MELAIAAVARVELIIVVDDENHENKVDFFILRFWLLGLALSLTLGH